MESPVQHFRLVMPEHMNHFGDLYGGNMLKWVDEIAWIAAWHARSTQGDPRRSLIRPSLAASSASAPLVPSLPLVVWRHKLKSTKWRVYGG